MNADSTLGEVLEKNVALIEDTLDVGKITAVKHGNGRDWWVLAREFYSNRYYRMRLTPNGVEGIESQTVGVPTIGPSVGQCAFSPDGTKYAQYNTYDLNIGQFVDIYDFDRCTGLLSSHIHLNLDNGAYSAGVAFSPNSRFLYASSFNKIYQYDLWSDHIPSSRKTVATYDGFIDFGETHFFLAQLAPDGKIYINASTTAARYLHVIHEPDQLGVACEVEQHGIHLPTYNAFSMPNNPNYRLGPWDGSPCDTLGLDNLPVAKFKFGQDGNDYLKIAFTDLSYYEPDAWAWDFGDGSQTDVQHTSHKYSQDGIYEVCLSIANEYGLDTFCQTLVIGTPSATESVPPPSVNIFPNPVSGHTNLILYGYLPKDARLSVVNGMGQLMHQQRVLSGWNTLDLTALPSGVYFYEVRDGERRLGAGKLVRVE